MTTPLPDDLGKCLACVGKVDLEQLREQNRAPIDAVPTHLPQWNKMCRDEGGGIGVARGWHVIVAGKTGAGKSLFGLNMAVEAIRHGDKVGFVSLEMSRRQLITRALAIQSGYSVKLLEPGPQYQDHSYEAAAQDWLEQLEDRLFVNSTPLQSLVDIGDEINRAHETEDVRYFVIDYMQLAWVSHADNLLAQITEVSHTIRGLARKLNVITVGLSQYNRETSKSTLAPEITGLMGGSSLENDADQVLLLDHTSYKRQPHGTATQNVLLAKNRHGSVGKIAVVWDYDTLRVTESTEGLPF
jgi:replicative DNA helicase